MDISRCLRAAGLLWVILAVSASCQPGKKADAPGMSAASIADSLARVASLERGQHAYLAFCAMCHGDGGDGDGDMAVVLRKQSNVTVARLNDRQMMGRLTRPELVSVIAKGGGHTGRSNLMPAWSERLVPAVIEDIATYVMTMADSNPAIPRATLKHFLEAPPGVPADGRVLFVRHCSGCHGSFGKGDGLFAAGLWKSHQVRPHDLTDSTYFATKTDRDLFAVISLGGGHFRKASQMPAWTVTLTPEQIMSVVAYVREVSHTAPKL